jgi:hypothetical protein
MNEELTHALKHLELTREYLAKYFKKFRINDQPRPECVSWAMTSITHAITYLEREIRERAK